MKNILVLIQDDDGQDARLQAALDAARALNGHLTCLHPVAVTPIVGDAFGMSGAVAVIEARQEAEAAVRRRVETKLAREDVPWDWIEMTADLEPAIEETADLADLIVVNRQLPRALQTATRILGERLVGKFGKPVLAVDDSATGFRPAERVLVAWDGSDPAAAAVRAAVPLLKLSESATIYEIDDGSVQQRAEMAAAYLSRHGVHADVVRDRAEQTDLVETMLLSKLAGRPFGWAVMGAFSKSRIREALFGGVTKRMLKDAPVPLFIAR